MCTYGACPGYSQLKWLYNNMYISTSPIAKPHSPFSCVHTFVMVYGRMRLVWVVVTLLLSFKFMQLNDSSCIAGCDAFAKYIRMQHSETSSSNPECPFVPVSGSLSIGEQVYISRGANCLLYSCQVWTILYFKIWCSWIEEICYHAGNSTRSSSTSFWRELLHTKHCTSELFAQLIAGSAAPCKLLWILLRFAYMYTVTWAYHLHM